MDALSCLVASLTCSSTEGQPSPIVPRCAHNFEDKETNAELPETTTDSGAWEEVDLDSHETDRCEAGMMMSPYGAGYGGYGGYGTGAMVMTAPTMSMAYGGMRQPIQWACLEPMAPLPDVPIGLEYLTMVDQLIIQQLVEPVEVMLGYETANRYVVRNRMGQRIFYCMEESNPNARQCCGNKRAFILHLVDNFGREVAILRRPNVCCSGQSGTVETPIGFQAGQMLQDCGCCGCNFTVFDAGGLPAFKIVGPWCKSCCPPGEFPIMAVGGSQIGTIMKLFTNMAQEIYTDADNYSLTFPLNLHPSLKVVLICAAFVIDFEYFEEKGGNGSRGVYAHY